MAKVIADISMSVDGFVTGPEPGPDQGLGRGGESLHTWATNSDDPTDTEVLREATHRSGAVVMGRRLFDIVDGPQGWNGEMGYGAGLAATPPFFVVTHSVPEHVRLELDFTFVTNGVASAIRDARTAAHDRDVVVMGGANVIRECLALDLLDELRIHLAPVVLGSGTPLFDAGEHHELEQRAVRVSPTATHLTYATGR